MRDVESINKEIDALKQQLSEVQGTPTEIYTRIVGYYRSLNNWNKGKREEYDKRQTFAYGRGRTGETPTENAGEAPRTRMTQPEPVEPADPATTPEPHAESGVAVAERTETTAVSSYAYFFRKTCPNCPPVRKLLEEAELGGDHFDVDTDDGFSKAAELQILATPTVVFFGADGSQIGRANAPKDVQRLLELAE